MTHFSLIAIVPKYLPDVFAYLSNKLFYYSEDLEVPSYLDNDGEQTTYNKNAKFDWFVIGGRFNGLLDGKYKDEESEKESDNIKRVTDISLDILPYAVYLPRGVWLYNVDRKFMRTVKEEYNDYMAVVVDYHI